MKVLMISTDRKIFEDDSDVRKRIISYSKLFDELHIVVFSLKNQQLRNEIISENTVIYPTNSISKLFYISDAIFVAKKMLKSAILKNWVISTQDPFETGIVGLSLSRKFKIPFQIQIHTDFLSPYFKKESHLNNIRLRLADRTLPNANCIRVVSKRIKQSVEIKYKNAVNPVVLPIFTDITRIRDSKPRYDIHEKYPQFNFIVIMNSRLESEKNIFLAIESFREVLRKHKSAGLVIVGDGSERNKLESFRDSLGLTKNIMFDGWQNDVATYYKTSDLFLNTSNYEGYALTLVEAAEARCPIITTNVGIVGDVLNESNVFVCSVGDRDCIEKKIINAINNKEMLETLSDKAFIDTQTKLLKNKEVYLEKYKESIESCIKE